MERRQVRGLLALNGALLGVLALIALGSAASGSEQPGARARGEYTMVSGQIKFGNSSGIWIIDAANQELVAVRWDDSRNALTGIDYRNLAADQARRPGR